MNPGFTKYMPLDTFLRVALKDDQELAIAIMDFARSAKDIASLVSLPSGVEQQKMTGDINVQSERVSALDDTTGAIFETRWGNSGCFTCLASEEKTDIITIPNGITRGSLISAFDPMDGSSSLLINAGFGSIAGFYKAVEGLDEDDKRHFYRAGKEMVAACYAHYGPSTIIVLTLGDGTFGFTLDPRPFAGDFLLTHPNIKIPEAQKVYSINEGYAPNWAQKKLNDFLWTLKEKGISQRYIGAMVSDIHRTLVKGGIFIYPADAKNENGKLRLLYECAPIAFILEQAGGAASTGTERILDIVPEHLHMRVPFFGGSKAFVERFEQALAV
jgi:fructose-1,6-bisphosphatase I